MLYQQENIIEIPICADKEEFFPVYASQLAAGADVKAYIASEMVIPPGCSALVPTGIRVAIPKGYEIQVRPRSGLALKNQVTVLNTPGTIDADYRGEIQVILMNHGKQEFVVQPGMRIAQLVVAPVFQASFVHVEELTDTERGHQGFGHTGVH
ncbi:MAG: dUTP diphosphatase [Parachlamydiaceae bacterium]